MISSARSRHGPSRTPQYADLDLANIVVVTLPQPVVVQMIRAGGIALGRRADPVSPRLYWARIFPNRFELVPILGAERFFLKIAFARVVDPPRARALRAFEEFFFGCARDAYPRYDFARMNDDEFGAALALE